MIIGITNAKKVRRGRMNCSGTLKLSDYWRRGVLTGFSFSFERSEKLSVTNLRRVAKMKKVLCIGRKVKGKTVIEKVLPTNVRKESK